MEVEKFNKLMEQAEKDLVIPEKLGTQMLIELSVAVSSKYQKWLGRYTTVYHEYENICLEIEKLRGDELLAIKSNKRPASNFGWKTKDEMESMYYQNQAFYDKMAEKNLLKVQTEYLERTLDAIKTMGFQIKNLIDIKKLSVGGI